ncbi:hypothetical protein M501DRAFT_933994, partial [Patellaria atrata CBS 101060]
AEQILEHAAHDGSFETNEWPRVLEFILARLDDIINDFPTPRQPPPEPRPPRLGSPLEPSSQDSQDKENAPPPRPNQTRPSASTSRDSTSPSDNSTLPPVLVTLHQSIRTSLSKNFTNGPPHTIQRLAELILKPKAHYHYLPSYLQALDRVSSVSSPASIFPLPQAILPTPSTGGLLNGTTATISSTATALGSDESLGGALLTPIPWLRNSNGSDHDFKSESTTIVDGPNGAGRIETVSVVSGMTSSPSTSPTSTSSSASSLATETPAPTLPDSGAVTQGELLRQEQEAGVVLVAQNSPRRSLRSSMGPSATTTNAGLSSVAAGGEEAASETPRLDEEHPHARGPEEIGMEDMGPQTQGTGGGLNIEAAVGRSLSESVEAKESEKGTGLGSPEIIMGEADDDKQAEKKDEDVELPDADSKTGTGEGVERSAPG